MTQPTRNRSPPKRTRHAREQRAHVRSRREGGRRPGLPRPRGRVRACRQGGGTRHRSRGADRTRLGQHDSRDPHQWARHPVVPRRHRRGGHRGPRCARRHHHPEGAERTRRLVGRRAAHAVGDGAGLDATHRARGSHRGGRWTAQRPGDRSRQSATGGHHLRGGRPVRVAALPGGRQLPTGRRLPRRLLARRARPGARRGPRRGRRRDRRALPRIPGRSRLPQGRDARQSAWLRREVGDPPRSGRRRQRASSRRRRRKSRRPAPSSPTIGVRRPRASAPLAAAESSSTRPSCATPRTSCDAPRSRA